MDSYCRDCGCELAGPAGYCSDCLEEWGGEVQELPEWD